MVGTFKLVGESIRAINNFVQALYNKMNIAWICVCLCSEKEENYHIAQNKRHTMGGVVIIWTHKCILWNCNLFCILLLEVVIRC